MMIRALRLDDIAALKEIHAKYYQYEFDFPDWIRGFLCAFVVIDDDKIVSAGGVRSIAESIAITNKDFSVRKRRESLFQILDASAWVTGKSGYDGLHAFIQDEVWKRHLEKVGFHNTKGQSLVLEL